MTFSKRIGSAVTAAKRAFSGRKLIVARYEGAFSTFLRSLVPGAVQDARLDASEATRVELTRKARYWEKNSAYVQRMGDLFEQYTVGQGIQFFPATSDEAFNTAAAEYWRKWKPFADLSSLQGFDTLQGVVARGFFIDGGSFILKTYGGSNPPFPRIQIIEGHRCKSPRNPPSDAVIVDGVEIDANGRPIAYHFETVDPKTNRATYRRIPAEFIVHVFEPGRAGQYREIPFLSSVLNDLNDLDDLQRLEMQAAKDAAATTNVIKTQTGEVDDEDIIRETDAAPDGVSRENYYKAVFGAEAKVLKWGDDMQQFRIERPSAATSGYWDTILRKICAGTGIPKELVLAESMQGTTLRSVLDMANTFFRMRSAVLCEKFGAVYAYVIQTGIANGDLPNPPQDWDRYTARAPRAVNVDIGRDSAARIAEFKLGMTTLQEIGADDGADWIDRLRQKTLEVQTAKKLADAAKLDRAEVLTLDPNELASRNSAGITTTAAAKP